jgi:hypothetical protein
MQDIQFIAQAVLGYVFQWVAFAPKKVPAWAAWGALAGLTVALWIWMTPNAAQQFQTSWRMAVWSILSFLLAAKGTGSMAKALGWAPATDSK